MFFTLFAASMVITVTALMGFYDLMTGPYPGLGAVAILILAVACIWLWYDALTCDVQD